MRRFRKQRMRLALWCLNLPKDTKGVMLPGTITFPPNTPVNIKDFYFITIEPKTLAIDLKSTEGSLKMMGG